MHVRVLLYEAFVLGVQKVSLLCSLPLNFRALRASRQREGRARESQRLLYSSAGHPENLG